MWKIKEGPLSALILRSLLTDATIIAGEVFYRDCASCESQRNGYQTLPANSESNRSSQTWKTKEGPPSALILHSLLTDAAIIAGEVFYRDCA